MSYYFREKPRFADKLRGKSGDELLEELKQQFADGGRQWETQGPRLGRDAFERHTSFPRGFPFDDEGGFGRRSDIRSHLDDLAARHPEFADHLLGSAWGEAPFSAGSLRRGNRRPSQERPSANSVFHNIPDEDARSQASGGSAASGASGVSSQGSEPEHADTDSSPSTRKIPQYNLRNTVDIGQHQHNMEAPQQQRNIRSMSAPPENRQNEPRFVSRVDINPQQEAQQQQQPPQTQQEPQTDKSPPPQQQQQSQPEHKGAKQQSNVRQIPIFVEGRDKPVIAKDVDEPDFPKRQSPPQFARPSQHYQSFNRHPAGWTSHFAEPFFEPPTNRWTNSPPTQSQFRHPPQSQQQEKPRYTYQAEAQPRPKSQFQTQQPQQQQPQPKPQQQHPQNEAQQEPPKPKQQIQPKDPLEKVAAVQQEVNALAEQVKEYSGSSRKDKQYMYLDEMLTRELIKLDDIDTEGKENVRTARKQAIKTIQDTISLLESKHPLPGQQTPQPQQMQEPEPAKQEEQTVEQPAAEKKEEAVAVKPEAMETQEAPAQEEPKAIPLPPPSSPTKDSPAAEAQQPPEVVVTAQEVQPQAQPEQAVQEAQPKAEAMDATSASSPAPQVQQQAPQEQQPMEVRQSSPTKELQPGKEQQKESQALIAEEQKQQVKESAAVAAAPEAQPATEKPKKEPPPVPAKPNRSPKKAKKAAKQPPAEQPAVSETAIPLPAPGQSI